MPKDILEPIQNSVVTDQAAAAIEGYLGMKPQDYLDAPEGTVRESELATKLAQLEVMRSSSQQYRNGRPWTWWRLPDTRNDEIRILRAEVSELMLAYAKKENQIANVETQASNYKNFVQTVGCESEAHAFYKWMREKFPADAANFDNNPGKILQFAQRIMERFK